MVTLNELFCLTEQTSLLIEEFLEQLFKYGNSSGKEELERYKKQFENDPEYRWSGVANNNELERLLTRFGVDELVKLFSFGGELKYSIMSPEAKREFSEDRKNQPSKVLCKEIFKNVKLPRLLRGVSVNPKTPIASKQENETIDISLKKPSYSSWTSDASIAGRYGKSTGDSVSFLLSIEDIGDGYIVLPYSKAPGVPEWFAELAHVYNWQAGADGGHGPDKDAQLKEYIMSLQHCKLKVERRSSHDPNSSGETWKRTNQPGEKEHKYLRKARVAASKGKLV